MLRDFTHIQAIAIIFVLSLSALVPQSRILHSPQHTLQTGNNMFPQWSHDGKRIIFTSTRDGDPEIFVMNADGSNPVRLTNTPGRDAHPQFSKDGQRVVFQSPRANGKDTNIYTMNSDGSSVKQLTSLKGFAGVPVYSPDEKLIAFQWRESNDFNDKRNWRICVMNSAKTFVSLQRVRQTIKCQTGHAMASGCCSFPTEQARTRSTR
jgi:Tol biopolymer transport system component